MIYRSRFIIVLLAALVLLAVKCKKPGPEYVVNIYEQYFETNILNVDFRVKLATDNGSDLTSQYEGYRFRLLKNTYYDGPMTATRNGVVINGTWSSNDDYSKLIITLNQPSVPAEFVWLNRSWRFTKKAIPIMELAPWGSQDPHVLHMERL